MIEDIATEAGFFSEYEKPPLGKTRKPGVVNSLGRKVVFTVFASGIAVAGIHSQKDKIDSRTNNIISVDVDAAQADASHDDIVDIIDIEMMRESLREDDFISLDEAIQMFDLPT